MPSRASSTVCRVLICLSVAGCADPPTAPPFSDFLADYEFVRAWGDSGSADGQFFYPQGVAVDATGHVYVVDTVNRRIQKFTRDGAYVTQWGSTGSGDGQFGYTNSMAVDRDGNVYVADAGNSRIQKFTSNGVYVTQWGSRGFGDGQFGEYGMKVAVAPDGSVYVLDTNQSRVQRFTADGTFVAKWGGWGNGWPTGLAVDGRGLVYVFDGRQGIHKFSGDGSFLQKWNFRPSTDSGSEHIAADGYGNVFVTDRSCGCIRKFTNGGWTETEWKLAGTWSWIPGIAVSPRGNVYVAMARDNQIFQYAPVLR